LERNRFRTTPVPSAQAEAQAVPWVARTVETGEMKKRKEKIESFRLAIAAKFGYNRKRKTDC